MCLAIPMRVQAVTGYTARCAAKGVVRDVSLFMLQDDMPKVGDYVAVETAYAVRTVSEADALASWALFDEILRATEPSGTASAAR